MLLGHQSILEDLKELADTDTLSHSYLFHGPAMVGKSLAARTLAEYLEFHQKDRAGSLLDCKFIEPVGGSIGIDAVREIKYFLWQKPNASSRRTLVIHNAELLTTEAQNALLKITEEPPSSSLLILVTSDEESLLPTIHSRFQKIYFGLVSEKQILDWLVADYAPGKSAKKKSAAQDSQVIDLKLIAQKAMGKPGLAWRLLYDDEFKDDLMLAEKFLKSSPATRRDLIKKIIEPEEFSLSNFLDSVILVLVWEKFLSSKSGRKEEIIHNPSFFNLWHKTFILRDRQANFGLNPRLQLENLLL